MIQNGNILQAASLILCGVLCGLLTGAASAADLTVFAASSLKEALDAQVSAFSTNSGHRVRVSYAGSNALAKQIENGAPAHIFLSADELWMDYLAQKKLIVADSRRDVVGNALVIVAPVASTARLTLAQGAAGVAAATLATELTAALGSGRLALANPDAVPAGKYARVALTRLGLWSAVENKLARAENVRAALAFVARGEAPLGIVYRTDALAEPRVKIVAIFPESTHPKIVYPAAIVAGQDSVAARAFLDHLTGEKAMPVWVRFGFTPPN